MYVNKCHITLGLLLHIEHGVQDGINDQSKKAINIRWITIYVVNSSFVFISGKP